MDEFEKMASGRLYNPAAPKLDAYHLQRMALCQQLNQTSILDQQTVERLKNRADSFIQREIAGTVFAVLLRIRHQYPRWQRMLY